MREEDIAEFKQLLSEYMEPVVQVVQQQSAQIELLKEQLRRQTAETNDLLSHIEAQLDNKQRPPVPISEAWEPLGFRSEAGLRGAINRKVYTQNAGEVLRRGASILVDVDKCLKNGFRPIHRRRHSA